ncbi:methionine ABC transporter permease [Bifidobacterium boum]|uniref:ABC transporter, permease n=1 Tax=Bifidobacterium boum TaxID=78343 RepID=A0A086ZIF9_9BIFI|nr:methionine ABC transporter permease [Bifidobacterium boum]KFI46309.1 ABC transporter, permease [Bifidobacterium boum]MCI5861887.1 ABC transporter permease [Bifidobacterium boum]MDD6087255.1 ABC transporter permease [Bifidobacterium boum]
MDSTWQILQEHLPQALIDTAYMVVVSAVVGVVLGSLVGLLLYLTENRLFHPNHVLNSVVGFIVNAIRSLPFLILLVVLIPVVQALIGDPYTPTGGAIALSVSAVPYFARISESAFSEVDDGIIEACLSTGATTRQVLTGAVLPQARPSFVRGVVLMIISLIGASAMVGTIGAGGIGDMAIQYGYNRYETGVLLVIVVILIVLVQIIQWIGDRRARHLTH